MRTLTLLVVVCFLFSLSTSAPTPDFPTQFSSSLDLYRSSQRRYFVSRWYRDQKQQVERFDTSGEQGWDIDIRRYDLGQRFTIFNDVDGKTCYVSNLTSTLPTIDLSNYNYRGPAVINRIPTYEYDAPNSNSIWTAYFQNQSNNEPVRLVSGGPTGEVLTFFEFNEGPQDTSLFNASAVAPGVTCRNEPTNPLGFVRIAGLDVHKGARYIDYYSPPFMNEPGNSTSPLDCETGDASWYDCSGKGACASCTPSDYTAAHKTLACGTSTTVTDTANGRSVKVKIEDRGPYVTGRIVDMNHAPAEALDMISAGVVPARVCW
jgi:hypothetical protein